MTTRFRIDLLHPGWVAQTWQDWFAGPQGARRLAVASLGGVVILGGILLAGILPTYGRLARDRDAIPALRRELAARDTDLAVMRTNLSALSQEARRQLSWTAFLTTLSREMPPSLKLQLVETTRTSVPASPGQSAGASPKPEQVLHIEALTPLRPGGPPLLDVAKFIGALSRDPAVSARYALRSWEIKPAGTQSPSGEALLSVSIWFAERAE